MERSFGARLRLTLASLGVFAGMAYGLTEGLQWVIEPENPVFGGQVTTEQALAVRSAAYGDGGLPRQISEDEMRSILENAGIESTSPVAEFHTIFQYGSDLWHVERRTRVLAFLMSPILLLPFVLRGGGRWWESLGALVPVLGWILILGWLWKSTGPNPKDRTPPPPLPVG